MEVVKKIQAVRPQMIKTKDIIKPGYQRRLDYTRAAKIAEHFDNRLLGTLLVSHRDGQYYIIDGQHRLVALRKLGITDAPCVVMTGLSDKKEAELFQLYNMQRKALDRSDLLTAKLAAADADAIDMMHKINAAGYTCGVQQQEHSKNKINITAVAAAERAYKQLRGNNFEKMLKLLAQVWPYEKDAVCASMLNGMSSFWTTYEGEFDCGILQKVLQDLTPFKVMAKANTLCESVNNRNLRVPIAQVVYKAYNTAAPKKLKAKLFKGEK